MGVWKVARRAIPGGTAIVIQRERDNKVARKLLGPAEEQEVGRVAADRPNSINPDLSYTAAINHVAKRAQQVASVKNNWHK